MKKLLLGLILLSVVFITACASGTEDDINTIETNEDIISMQVLTTASLLQKSSHQLSSENIQEDIFKLTEETTEATTGLSTARVVEQVEPYIELVEQFLGSNNGLEVVVESSNLEEYEWMMSFDTKSLLGENQRYVIHYNMILEEEDDEDESEFSLDGIMILGGETYQLTGEREVEADEEEVEFIAVLDDDNYVESSYSVETEETEFEIKIVANGETVSETSIGIENEEEETQVELEFVDGENTGAYEFTYEMENDVPILIIEFEVTIDGVEDSGEMTLSIHTDDTTGETYYTVYRETDEETYEERYDRDIDDDDDDDDEE